MVSRSSRRSGKRSKSRRRKRSYFSKTKKNTYRSSSFLNATAVRNYDSTPSVDFGQLKDYFERVYAIHTTRAYPPFLGI